MKMNARNSIKLAGLLWCVLGLQTTHAQSAAADLDRDGIPNISDRDVDNDGTLNGADRNIDGGIARSGPLRGRYIGDNFPNDSSQELDMDADGLADIALAEKDIDGDGLADVAPNETDIDGDGRLDGERRETDIDGDGLLDNAAGETDIDGDALPDHSDEEKDIDGDGFADGVKGEVDIDGDGSVNGSDTDVDGDGLANTADADMDGTGVLDDIFSGVEHNYLPDSEVAPIIASVSAEVRETLNIAANDAGLRVRVLRESFLGPFTGPIVSGVWRYLSSDQMQVWAVWSYPASDPSKLQVFTSYGRSINALVAQFPRGSFSSISWEPGEPLEFTYFAPHESQTGFPAPVNALRSAFGARPNFKNQDLMFSFDIYPTFTGVQPIVELQRQLFGITRNWNSQYELQQLR